MQTMGDRLKWCRRRYGWTQRDLARVTGVGLATIRRIEQHEFEPRLDTVRRLAATFHVRAGWLAFGEEPMLDRRSPTADAQDRGQSRLSEDKPLQDATAGPWYWDGDEWQVDRSRREHEETG